MTLESKTRIVGGLLVLLTFWPLVQMTLVWRYDVSPWKLAGWGMYSTPILLPQVFVDALVDGEWSRVDLKTLPPKLAEQAHLYARDRRALGNLHAPESLAALLLATRPEWEAVRINVVTRKLDDGRMAWNSASYPYPRARGRAVTR